MTHNKQGYQKNIVYIFIQICRVFVSNFFTALLHSPLPCNESCSVCAHTWQEKCLCIEGKLNAKQTERISPAINLLRAELLCLAGVLSQPPGHCWYYDFLSSCKQQSLLNGYSGLGQSWICQALAAREVLPPEALKGFFFFQLSHPETQGSPTAELFRKMPSFTCLISPALPWMFWPISRCVTAQGQLTQLSCPFAVFTVATLDGKGKMLHSGS